LWIFTATNLLVRQIEQLTTTDFLSSLSGTSGTMMCLGIMISLRCSTDRATMLVSVYAGKSLRNVGKLLDVANRRRAIRTFGLRINAMSQSSSHAPKRMSIGACRRPNRSIGRAGIFVSGGRIERQASIDIVEAQGAELTRAIRRFGSWLMRRLRLACQLPRFEMLGHDPFNESSLLRGDFRGSVIAGSHA